MNKKYKFSILGLSLLFFIGFSSCGMAMPWPGEGGSPPPPPPPPPPEKIAVFIWDSGLGSSSKINSYANKLIVFKGYTKIYKIEDLKNLDTGETYDKILEFFEELDEYEGSQETIFFYLWGHGPDSATVNLHDDFYSTTLKLYLGALEAQRIGFLVESCKSGGFVTRMEDRSYLAMSSSRWDRDSYAWPKWDPEGRFSYWFWYALPYFVNAYGAWDYARDQNFWDPVWYWGLKALAGYHFQYPQYDNNLYEQTGYMFFA